MKNKIILETERLILREFELNDHEFITELVNTLDWLKYIGDKKVYTPQDAKEYLENGPIKSYKKNGYGLWLVQLRDTGIPIGMCGLINRKTLENIDIGFALLPKYYGNGYALEMAEATMKYSKTNLNLDKIVAISDPDNKSSIKLLNRIGFHFVETIELKENDTVLLYASSN